MLDAISLSKYSGVVLALVAAGMGMPIPEEIPIVTAGAMVGHDAQALAYYPDLYGAVGGGIMAVNTPAPRGLTRWWIMLPVVVVGVVAADCILYFVGRRYGNYLLSRSWVQKRLLPPEKQRQIEENFKKNGIMILLGARFTPGIRTPVFLMAGILGMPLRSFLIADALYAVPGVNLLFWLAYWFTDQFVEAVTAADRYRPMILVAVLAAVLGAVLYKFITSRKLSTGNVEDIPTIVKPVGAVTHAVERTIEMTVDKTFETAAVMIDKVTHPMGHSGPASSRTEQKPPAAEASPPPVPPCS